VADADAKERWRSGWLDAVVYDSGVERERVARVFGRLMWGYDTRLLFAEIERLGELPDGASVLDAPCGGGLAFRGLRPGQRLRYVAADISPVMLRRARRQAERRGLAGAIELVEADVEALPFGDGEFDLCLTLNSLHCLPDPGRALAEMARVLGPGGTLRGTTAIIGEGTRYDRLIALYRRTGTFGAVPSAEDLRNSLLAAGFTDVALRAAGAIAFFECARSSPSPF
jgi:ubiquinone/menaquinone biosynthesis C-methylase UbiE